jgi:hypothetical protein
MRKYASSVLRCALRRRKFLSKRDGECPATVRCRESLVLSSREQDAPIALAVEPQDSLFGRGVRLD